MEYSSRSNDAEAIKMEARDLAQNLLSRDPILFNSALNAYFDANASYHGHALRIKGISQIKHAAWLWNMLNLGRSTDLVSKDVHWNHKNLTLSLTATRHLRPVTLPIFTFAVPVKSIITFEPTRDDDNVDHLYAVHWEDQWPLGHALEHLPIVGFFVTAVLSPIASYFFLALSNFLFAIDARTRTFARHWTGPQAQQQYSQTVPASVRQGFEQGERVAQGWGQYLLSGGTRAAYPPLKALEWTAQTAVAIASQVSPVRLPAVSVFDPQTRGEVRSIIHGAPLNEPVPVRTQKSLAATESHAKRTAQEDVTNPRGEAQHAETAPYELPATMVDGNKGGIKKATVEVGPSVDAKAKSFDVSKHQHNDAKQNPSHGREAPRPSADGTDAKKASLFEQVDKSTLESAEKAAEKAARKAKKAAERRSEEDGHKSKQTKTKHSSDDSGSDGRVESAKSSGKSSQTNTPTKKRKDHGGRH